MTIIEFKEWKERLCLTNEAAARELGVTLSTIYRWQTDRSLIPKRVQLACKQIEDEHCK